jgi:hypothetical protein
MNLHGWFTAARLAGEAGIDLWHYRTTDGRSLRGALDYLVRFSGEGAAWPHQQITSVDHGEFVDLLEQAARAWTDGGYGGLAARLRQRSK